jgi:beta-mannanase
MDVSARPHLESSARDPVWLGVYQHGAPWEIVPLDEFEAQAGRAVDVVLWYQDWVQTRDLELRLLEQVAARGAVPLLTWEPWDHTQGPSQPAFALERLLAGDHDAHIAAWAAGLAAYGGPVLHRFAHEMNGHWYPWGSKGGPAAQYVAAWRHVWAIFQQAGAHQVQWVWSPNILVGADAFEPYYPGAAYVDWLGLDGYNWGGWGGWRSFRQLFTASYQRLCALGDQPVMIAEVGCAERGGSKARWIAEAFTEVLPQQLPRVRAVVWFNQHKERDWRITSSPHSRRAFAQAVASPPFRQLRA